MRVIRPFDSIAATDVETAGGKGANLGELTAAGLPVPPGFVIATAGYDAFVEHTGIGDKIAAAADEVGEDDHQAADRAAAQIAGFFAGATIPAHIAEQIIDGYRAMGDRVAVAVRSSATAEDLADASFAGQQDTYLNIRGDDHLLAAVRDCWASLWTPRAIAYRRRRGIDPRTVSLAVVVQQLVEADAAGVLFTANPTNGRRDETVISAAWGLGESVVGGTVTTDNLTVRRSQGRWVITDRDVADKQLQTVRTEAGTEEIAVPDGLRRRPVLTDTDAIGLAELGDRVAEHYGRPMDLEWARAGGDLWLVQARAITALPDPVGDAPTDWPVPDPKRVYFRASIVEMMPEPLTPLFGDLIEPAVVGSLGELLGSLLGPLTPHELVTFPTVNGYAYYAYRWADLLKMTALSPAAMIRIFSGGTGGAEKQWRTVYRPQYQQTVRSWTEKDAATLSAAELLTGATELLAAGCRYYTGVQQVIPVAAMTETSFARLYRPFRRAGDPEPTTFVLGLESAPMRAERELYGLGRWCREQPGLLDALSAVDSDGLVGGPAPQGVATEVWQQWQQRIGDYLKEFGHTISDLDFSNPVAADDPSAVLETVRFHARDDRPREEADPAVRQRRLADERQRATSALLARTGPARRVIGPVLAKAQRYGGVREDALADVGLGWPRIRQLLAELGRRLVDHGLLAEADDVYWLRADEIGSLVAVLDDAGEPSVGPDELAASIADRRMSWRGRRTVTPPQMLPVESRMNRMMNRWMPAVESSGDGPELHGLGASGGKITGRACLINDHSDFAAMRPGMIIVAKITTPAYTPLFAMAGGVVTDIGGPLSHSSIVAREYGIPAVLGTGDATRRIKHGDEITVDGTAGLVTLPDDDSAPEDVSAVASGQRVEAG
ncbi:PEP/pyruvate-binding domain-containing protein [Microlunatus soli]|uniref:Phosphoenolpyruvate synthase n=1 Tax=Microlunatus soli TaxID=630515 RepID=A0A1H1ZX93_9ACTN|nr:PEP/pyruvate-binding domain-containing protein [Microlunatus soli]SDT37866.1 phosphoenolpyruvate synthase [Microlunatus soli]